MATGWTGAVSAPRWYCAAVALFLGVRAISTLVAGASFAMPAPALALIVGLVYVIATGLELVHGNDLFGVVPVDTRDRFVHPLLAVLAFFCFELSRRRQHSAERL
jgi:hypothetical protein